MTLFRRMRLLSKRASPGNLEYLGEDFLRRATHAARKESWGRTVLQLAWTAGPVTYLALQGGYMLGYGTSAPSNLFIYFAAYTVIAGVFAVAIRFLYQFTRGQEMEKAQAALSYALARLPDLILAARNETLLYYDEENRKLLAAKWLLENPDSGAPTIREAVFDVTGDDVLADAARRIEIFRRNGLSARITDEYSLVADRLDGTLENVRLSSQALADLLYRRFTGSPPGKRSGRQRTEGFIVRVLAAGEKNDLEAMSLNDAEEVFTLAYELLAGRDIPLFSVRYTGSKEFTEASENFDRSRIAFHKAAYLRNSKLRELAELFAESDTMDIVPAAAPVFSRVDTMYANILKTLEQSYRDLRKKTGGLSPLRKKRQGNGELRELFEQFDYALKLHRSLRGANTLLNKDYIALRRAEDRYYEVREKSAKQFPLHLLKPGEHGRGIRIVEKHIGLSRKSSTRFARDLQRFLQDFDNNPSPGTGDYKKLAVDIAIKLERELKLSSFEVQHAVEGSMAPYLSELDVDMTEATKAGLAVSLVLEVQKNMQAPIHRLAYVLVNYHGMPLEEESIEFLAEHYGADPERLQKLMPERETGTSASRAGQPRHAGSPPHLLEIQRLEKKYRELLDNAVKMKIL